jgi:serralysin
MRPITLNDHDELQDPTIAGQDISFSPKSLMADSVKPGLDPIRTVVASGNRSIDGLLIGPAWTYTTITFSFPTSPSAYDVGYSEAGQGFRGVSAAQHAAADFVLTGKSSLSGYSTMGLGSVASFTNETFTDVGSGPATLMLGSSNLPPTAYTYTPANSAKSGDIWFGQAYDGLSYADYRTPAPGNYAYMTMIHELGHALGLKHGHETGGVADETLPAASDDLEYSVMTYASYIGSPAVSDTCALDSNPQTYMMDDIAALQYLYGANFAVLGPTRYSWSPNTGETMVNGVGQGRPGNAGDSAADRNKIFLTIWNGDGREATYDFSAYHTGVRINLNPGQYSVGSNAQLAQLGPVQYARANVYNALEYKNDARSLIANAVGGSGDDAVVGNDADNVLEGGLGNNVIDGGGGYDTALYQVSRQQAVITLDGDGSVDVSFRGGQDSLTNIEALQFNNVTLSTAKMLWMGYSDKTTGTSGAVAMDDPTANNPSYIHSQYIYAGSDGMAASTSAANVFIHTGSGDDAIQVSSGQNVLDGGLGSNFLSGGTGKDTFFTDARNPGVVWNTIRGFHAGDAATLWGFDAKVSSFHWDSSVSGAAGSQGATLRADIVGGLGRTGNGIDASITFAGMSLQRAQGLQVSTGTQAGGTYLYLYNPGV